MERPDPVPVDHLSERQLEDLVRLLDQTWWSGGRTLEHVRARVAGSDLVYGYADVDGRLVAFARVLTDFARKAMIYDVLVDPAWRGAGLGRALMDRVVTDARLAGVPHLELHCLPEMEAFYARWGFGPDPGGVRVMRLARPD